MKIEANPEAHRYLDADPHHKLQKRLGLDYKQNFRFSCWLMEKSETAMKTIPAISIVGSAEI
jgi:hypothetical protein